MIAFYTWSGKAVITDMPVVCAHIATFPYKWWMRSRGFSGTQLNSGSRQGAVSAASCGAVLDEG
jgi:hypothetical protein